MGAFDFIKNKFDETVNFNFHFGNVVRVLMKGGLPKFDLIYSSGMFDYFDVASSKRLVKKLWDNVNPGGTLIVTNAHPDNPTKFWMEYVSDWFLEYKTKEEMLSLVEEIGNVEKVEVEIDPFGVYQYLKIRRTNC
jgi:extracellular factor (EF) 3-hydroxypalmitic acid methyl ester biosynthesis protein